jgi:hypothetical protein
MINYKKPLIFNIERINRKKQNPETDLNNNSNDTEHKKRAPWSKEVKEKLKVGRRSNSNFGKRPRNEKLDSPCQKAQRIIQR